MLDTFLRARVDVLSAAASCLAAPRGTARLVVNGGLGGIPFSLVTVTG
ncbi:hypothetical protein [Streptomyces europaeiscabiei]